jgi:hypothetical protein
MFALVLLEPVLWQKLLMTITLTTVVGFLLVKDDWAQPWIIYQFKRVINKFVSYA